MSLCSVSVVYSIDLWNPGQDPRPRTNPPSAQVALATAKSSGCCWCQKLWEEWIEIGIPQFESVWYRFIYDVDVLWATEPHFTSQFGWFSVINLWCVSLGTQYFSHGHMELGGGSTQQLLVRKIVNQVPFMTGVSRFRFLKNRITLEPTVLSSHSLFESLYRSYSCWDWFYSWLSSSYCR